MSRQPRDPFIFLFKKVKDHPLVGIKKPYSRFEAWTWMLCEARHKTDGPLQIGEFFAPYTYLQQKWGWTKKREVRTFLDLLKRPDGHGITMIETREMAPSDVPPETRHRYRPSRARVAPRLLIVKITNFKDYQFNGYSSAQVEPRSSPGRAQVEPRSSIVKITNFKDYPLNGKDSSAQVEPRSSPKSSPSRARSLRKEEKECKRTGGEEEISTPTEKYHQTVELTDQEEQLAEIDAKLPELAKQFPRLDVHFEFEQWKDNLAAKAKFLVEYEPDFRKWLRNSEKWRKEREGPDAENEPLGRPGPDYWYDNDFKTWVKK